MKTVYADEQTESISIGHLRELLGHHAVLLPCVGKRPVIAGWQKLTAKVMEKQDHLVKLEHAPNIGVLLGSPSGGLCAIDIDRDELVEPFLSVNPELCDTSQTRGARGRVFWIRCVGEYPQGTVKLKTLTGDDAGEFRSNGSQSIVAGVHPSGRHYQLVVNRPPLAVEFASIRWDGVCVPPNRPRAADTPHPTEPPLSLCRSVYSGISVHSVTTIVSADEVVKLSTVSDVHTSHRKLFDLARGVLSLERGLGRVLSDGELAELFGRWYAASSANLRSDQSRAKYFSEFLDACDLAEHGLDENSLLQAWANAQQSGLPQVAVTFKSPDVRSLVGLCFQLQRHAGEGPFYLACRSAARLLKVSHVQAARFLRLLVRKGVLQVVEMGGPETNRATRYRFSKSHLKGIVI